MGVWEYGRMGVWEYGSMDDSFHERSSIRPHVHTSIRPHVHTSIRPYLHTSILKRSFLPLGFIGKPGATEFVEDAIIEPRGIAGLAENAEGAGLEQVALG